jgi:uncharacterized membrane protein
VTRSQDTRKERDRIVHFQSSGRLLHVLLLLLLLLLLLFVLFLGQLFHSAAASVRKSSICFQLSSSKTFFGIIRKTRKKVLEHH